MLTPDSSRPPRGSIQRVPPPPRQGGQARSGSLRGRASSTVPSGQPTLQSGGVRVDPVHDVQLLRGARRARRPGRTRSRVEGGRDVLTLAKGRLGHVGPPSQGPVGLVEHVQRVVEESVVGKGQALSGAGRRTAAASGGPGRGRSRVAGVEGRSTPASGSFTPTASPANSTPLSVSCSATWCLA